MKHRSSTLPCFPFLASPLLVQAAGPELAFARALLRTGISTKIGFIPAAIGGHGMFTDYCPTCWFYQEMVKNTKAAIAAFGGRAVLRGVLFVQVGVV